MRADFRLHTVHLSLFTLASSSVRRFLHCRHLPASRSISGQYHIFRVLIIPKAEINRVPQSTVLGQFRV
jgi:hypothetical protein